MDADLIQAQEDYRITGSPFPNENVSEETKQLPEYGLLYAKAMYGSTNRFGINGGLFWNEGDYEFLMEVAQGRQSVDNIRKMFGYFRDVNSEADNDGSANLAFMDIQVLNLAPKYVNRAVDKMVGLQYDVNLEVVDPVSVHEKATYEAAIGAWYEFKGWLSELKMNPKDFFEDLDVNVLPEFPDELMYEMLTNPKIKRAIDGELTVKLLHEITDFNQKMRMIAKDKVTYGRGHAHCYRDINGRPSFDRINPKYYIGSYVENENFKPQEYAGFIDFPTVNQFRKEASKSMSQEDIDKVVQHYTADTSNRVNLSPNRGGEAFDGLTYIPVMRFYFLSEDHRVYVKRKDQYNNPTLLKRKLSYLCGESIGLIH